MLTTPNMDLHTCLAHWARQRPDRTALADAGRTLSFGQLDAEVAGAAGGLRALGFAPGDCLGIGLRDGTDMVVALLGAMRAGLVAAPLDWRARPTERASLARGFGLRAVVVPGAPQHSGELAWPVPARAQTQASHRPETPTLLLLSSGTTGAPSGALISAGALAARIQAGATSLGDLSAHLYLSCIPLFFSMGATTALRMLAHGSSVHIHPPLYTAEELLASAISLRATALCLVPTALRSLLRAAPGPRPLPDLRLLVVGGAALPADLRREAFDRLGPACFETYGSAATGPVTYAAFDELLDHPGGVGRPHPWLELRCLGSGGSILPPGQPGRLAVRGPTVAAALLTLDGDIQLLPDGWYEPGDVARVDEAGYLHIEGRSTDVVNRSGINVYPELVEQVLLGHPAVKDAAVVGHHRLDGDEEVIALVVLSEADAIGDLPALCRARLSPKYLPDQILAVASLPRTASGKIRRSAARDAWLQARSGSAPGNDSPSSTPGTPPGG